MKNALPKLLIVILFNMQHVLAYPPHVYDYNLHDASTFEIKLSGSGFITVSIDGDYFPEQVKKFSVNNLPAGNHYVEIYSEKIQHSGYYSNTQRVKLYAGSVYIKPASLIYAVVDNYGRFYIKNVQQVMVYPEPNQPYYQPYQPNVCYAPMAMQDYDFKQLLDVINDQWYDSGKLSIAKQAASANWLTTAQVTSIMKTMWYEDTKLDFAKYAYTKVIDNQNYFLVNKEFWYSSSVESLNRYLATLH